MSANYKDIRQIAMGDQPHEAIANLLIQQNSTSQNLASVLRAAHDRILHLASTAVVATNDSEAETLRRQLADAEARIQQFSGELTAALAQVTEEREAKNALQGEVNRLNAELQHIRDNYDLEEDEEGGEGAPESEEEGELRPEDRENELDHSEGEEGDASKS